MCVGHLCTGGEDKRALIWDLTMQPTVKEPILEYEAPYEINQLSWSYTQPEWIACAFHNSVQILRV